MKTLQDLFDYGEKKGMRKDSSWYRFWGEICDTYGFDPHDPEWEMEDETYDDICDEVDMLFE